MKEQEQAYAIQEGHRNKAENEYFAARPQIDSGDRRNVFDAGFDRGYLAASTPLLERIAELEKDKTRLEWLVCNEAQVWEVNGRYAVHDVTEHYPSTGEFKTSREAIDAAMGDNALQRKLLLKILDVRNRTNP